MSVIKKGVNESIVEMNQIVMPTHTNPTGNIFGGIVMSWVDIAAIMCGTRHSGMDMVTVHIDQVTFLKPIKLGDQANIKAKATYVGNSSMEIKVVVSKVDPKSNQFCVTTTAYLVLVAIDEDGIKHKIPGLILNSQEEIDLNKNAILRMKNRKASEKIITNNDELL